MQTTITTNMSELKKRAILAKQRMRMGYWQRMNAEKQRQLENIEKADVQSMQLVKEIQRATILRDEGSALGIMSVERDEMLYQKVVALLESNEIILNPIGVLVEKELYEKMDSGNRQKYILDLSKKFCEMKERYHLEKMNEVAVGFNG